MSPFKNVLSLISIRFRQSNSPQGKVLVLPTTNSSLSVPIVLNKQACTNYPSQISICTCRYNVLLCSLWLSTNLWVSQCQDHCSNNGTTFYSRRCRLVKEQTVLERLSLSKSCFTVRRGEAKQWLLKESLNITKAALGCICGHIMAWVI